MAGDGRGWTRARAEVGNGQVEVRVDVLGMGMGTGMVLLLCRRNTPDQLDLQHRIKAVVEVDQGGGYPNPSPHAWLLVGHHFPSRSGEGICGPSNILHSVVTLGVVPIPPPGGTDRWCCFGSPLQNPAKPLQPGNADHGVAPWVLFGRADNIDKLHGSCASARCKTQPPLNTCRDWRDRRKEGGVQGCMTTEP